MGLLSSLLRKARWVHGRAHLQRFVRSVPLALLREFRGRLGVVLNSGEQYGDMLGEAWLARVCAAVCAAHYVEHQLR
jgi:hypothetical protein